MISVTVVNMMLELRAGPMPFFYQQWNGRTGYPCEDQIEQHAESDHQPKTGAAFPHENE
jgi:hypothetical protein